jgi:uncharacterized membrane protein YheB (UPF0754 family)
MVSIHESEACNISDEWIFREFLLNETSEKMQSLSEYEAMQIAGFHERLNDIVRQFIQKHFHWITMNYVYTENQFLLTVDLSFLKSSEEALNPLQDDRLKHLPYRKDFKLNEKSFETETSNKTEIVNTCFCKKMLTISLF